MSKVAKAAIKKKAAEKKAAIQSMKLTIQRHMGLTIKERREKLELRGSELGQLVGCSGGNIFAIESGASQVNVEVLLKICAVLDCTPNEIYPKVPKAITKERIVKEIVNIKWE